jgi:hypothetical protein
VNNPYNAVMRTFVGVMIAILCTAAAVRAENLDSFPAGTFTLHAQLAVTDDVEATDYLIPAATIGAGWYIRDSLAIGVEVGGYSFFQGSGDDTPGVNASAFLRHHFIDTPRYSVYFDVFFGPTYTDTKTPAGGTHLNYLTRFGVGGTVPLDERLDLLAGVRWFHLSNANIHGEDENPAINGIQYYVGLLWRW